MRPYLFAALLALLGVAALWPTSRASIFKLRSMPPKTFAEATAALEKLTGSKGEAGKAPDDQPLDGVVLFKVKGDGAALVQQNQVAFRSAGTSLFLYDHGFGIREDIVGIAPTTDKLDLVRRVQTDAANYGHDNAAVIGWLREIDRDEPFDLTGAGADFVEGVFRDPVKQPEKLARSIYAFCPDFWSQGIGVNLKGDPNVLLAQYFSSSANRAFFFWWD